MMHGRQHHESGAHLMAGLEKVGIEFFTPSSS
jgi:hypothetical protein